MFKKCFGLMLGAVMVMASGCGGDDAITISGVVFTLDDLSNAEGACVFLLQENEDDELIISEPTGADGAYSIDVPAGTPFLLVADDCENRMENNVGDYYPTINADIVFQEEITEDAMGWPIHVGTNISKVSDGANATWENYFDNATVEADLFDPITSIYDADLGAFIFLGTFFIDTTSETFFEDFQVGQSVSIDDENCPVGYINNDTTFDGNGFPDPTLGPDVFQEDGTSTDISGNALSFCTSDVADSVNFTLNSPGRTLGGEALETETWELPTRDFSCTVLFPASIDGTRVHIADVFALFAG